MTSQRDDRWPFIEELLDAALELPAERRAKFLAQACPDDTYVREEVERLLRACAESERFLSTPAAEFAAPLVGAIPQPVEGELSPDDMVSRYRIVERVGAGGMGVVYRAQDTQLGRSVALKFLPPALTADSTARARLLAEARAVSALDHPNLAVVHEIGETDDGRQFIAMAWYEGSTLKDMLAAGAASVEDAIRLTAQIASALSVAHRAGIVHRDIKPSNILVTTEGIAKLVDFGIAKTADADLTKEGTTLGTIAYMSPEQTRGDAVDKRTDIWGLGVVLYEMLTGERPFRGESEQTLIYAIRNDDPPPVTALRPQVTAALGKIVDSCLAKLAAERCPSAEELLERLLALDIAIFDSDEAALIRGNRGRVRWRAPVAWRNRRLLPTVATVSAAALVAAAAWYSVSGREAETPLDPRRVVVVPLENRTGRAALEQVGHMAADWIIQGLADTRLVDVVPLAAAFAAADVAADSAGRPRGHSPVGVVARQTGAGIVVAGSYYQQGDSLYLRAAVTDAIEERVLHALEAISTAPVAAIEQLRQRVMGALAPRLFPVGTYEAVVSRPPSFEAYRAFMRGLQLFLDYDFAAAVPHFNEAASHDSTFTLPLIHAGAAYSLMGNHPALDSLLRILRPQLDRLNEVDRLGFDILQARINGDLEAFHRLSRRAPASSRSTALPWRIANSAIWVNRPRELIMQRQQDGLERGALRGWRLDWINVGQAHHLLGEHREELQIARRARQLYPTDTLLVRLEVHALAALRRPRQLQDLLRSLGEGPPNPAYMMRWAGLELQVHGAEEPGATFLRQSLEWQLSRPAPTPQAQLFLAESHALVGNLEEANSLLLELDRKQPGSPFIRGVLGTVAAKRGDRARALEISDWLASLDPPYYRFIATYRRARIAAQLGEMAAAVELLRQSYQEGMILWADLHYDPDFAPLRDYPPYQEFIRPRG